MRRYLTGALNFLHIVAETVQIFFLSNHNEHITFFNDIIWFWRKVKGFFCGNSAFHHSTHLLLDADNI